MDRKEKILSLKGQYHHDQQGMESSASFRLTQWLKIMFPNINVVHTIHLKGAYNISNYPKRKKK